MPALFALLARPLFRDAVLGALLLAALAGAWGYWQWSRAAMAALHANLAQVQRQAGDLAAAKDAMERDLALIKAAQDYANSDLARAREQAAQLAKALRAAQAQSAARARADPHGYQSDLNRSQADTLRALEGLTR